MHTRTREKPLLLQNEAPETTPESDAATQATLDSASSRGAHVASPDGSFPLPGDVDFLEAILSAFEANVIDTQEALDRKAVHDLILRAR